MRVCTCEFKTCGFDIGGIGAAYLLSYHDAHVPEEVCHAEAGQ